jgi:hypothetical protein
MQRLVSLAPRGDGVFEVEPAHVGELLGQLCQRRVGVEIGMDELGPGRRGVREDRPVDQTLVDHLEALLEIRQLIASGPLGVDPVEDPR